MGIDQPQPSRLTEIYYSHPFPEDSIIGQTNCYHTQCEYTAALRQSNLVFRRSIIGAELLRVGEAAPDGTLRVCNMNNHSREFVGFVVRAVAYAQDCGMGNPYDTGECGELIVDAKRISWEIKLATKCGTLKSAVGADPTVIARSLVITLPSN